jgi:hypothetical protein
MANRNSLLCPSCGEAIDELPQPGYTSLTGKGQIRLFKIHKANSYNLTICGALTTTDLNEDYASRLKYTAISYEWGPNDANPLIVVNGQNFPVRRNLYNFLLRYREAVGPSRDKHIGRWYKYVYPSPDYDVEYIWIDQICINQRSNFERNQQVQLMSKIYSKAEYVIAWLGSEPAVEKYLEYANHLAPSGQGSNALPNEDQLNMLADRFVNLSYWKRLWIHQEVLLGKGGLMFMAGQALVSRKILTELHMHHRPKSTIIYERPWPPVLNDLLMYDLSSWNWNGDLHLYYVVCTFSSNHCEDPRDKVYGLQGLVTHDERIEANYSLSTRDVFLSAVDKILDAGIFDISDQYTDYDGPYRASSRLEFLRQAEDMRKNLERLAENMGVKLGQGEVEKKLLLDFLHPRRANKLAKVPVGSSLRREIVRELWDLVRRVVFVPESGLPLVMMHSGQKHGS